MKQRAVIMSSIAAPFLFIGVVFFLVLCMPTNYTGTGSMFNYPLYSDHGIQALYTTGTWIWLYGLIWIAEITINDKFHEPTYDFIMNSSMYGYLSHYLWIAVISSYIVAPSGMNYPLAVIVEFVGTIAIIGLSYKLIEQLSSLCCAPKERDPEAHEAHKGDESVPSEELSSSRLDSAKTPAMFGTIDSSNVPW
jgi:hypothetical protein